MNFQFIFNVCDKILTGIIWLDMSSLFLIVSVTIKFPFVWQNLHYDSVYLSDDMISHNLISLF